MTKALVKLVRASLAFLCLLSIPLAKVQAQRTAAGPGTITEPAAQAPSPWGLSYFNFAMAPKANVDEGVTAASWMFDQYLAVGYKLSPTEKVSARFGFLSTTGGKMGPFQREASTKLGDFSVSYNNFSFWKNDNWNLSGTFYGYLPTSETSQEREWLTRLKAWMILENKLTPNWTFLANWEPDVYLNRKSEYQVKKVGRNGAVTTEWTNANIGNLKQYATLMYFVNDTFEPFVSGGLSHRWNQTSSLTTKGPSYAESINVAAGTWIKVNRQFRMLAQVINDVPTQGRDLKRPYGYGRTDDLSYNIILFGTIL